MERYRDASVEEFIMASNGYWRTWERNIAWLAREINYISILSNAYIEKNDKPSSRHEYMPLSMDEVKEVEPVTQDDINKTEEKLRNINGKK